MKLYNADLSPNCLRVRAVINELELPVELVEVDLFSQEPRPEALLAANPNGKVPVFVDDDGFTLFESRAINAYLAQKRPERDLYPSAPKRRAIVDQWSFWHAIHLGPAMQTVAFERVLKPQWGMGPSDDALAEAKLKEVTRLLAVLETGLTDDWLAGSLTLADFAVASTFILRAPSGISFADTPRVAAWIERVEALPSWQRALPRQLSR